MRDFMPVAHDRIYRLSSTLIIKVDLQRISPVFVECRSDFKERLRIWILNRSKSGGGVVRHSVAGSLSAVVDEYADQRLFEESTRHDAQVLGPMRLKFDIA